jgi:NDP-sugar pyrophosphorylase family protein
MTALSHAVLIATGFEAKLAPLIHEKPTPLLKVIDRPILFYILEFLKTQGVERVEIVLSYLPELIEERCGQGERWGLQLNYHLARDPKQPFTDLKGVVETWGEGPLLVGKGDLLPHVAIQNAARSLLFMTEDNTWTGWGVLSAQELIEGAKDPVKQVVSEYISTCSFEELHRSNLLSLHHPAKAGLFPATAHQTAPGIWISHGVSLPSSVTLTAPVFIGENCQVHPHAQLGPAVVIETNCIIDAGSNIKRSLICQRSYLGEKLAVDNCLISKNFLVNFNYQTHLQIRDEFILGQVPKTHFARKCLGYLERVLALVLWVLLSPVYFWLKHQCSIEEKYVLRLPASTQHWKWKTFPWRTFKPTTVFQERFAWLPNLSSIWRGDAHFVGIAPRTKEEILQLPSDWKNLALKCKVGCIHPLQDAEEGQVITQDDLYAAEAYYALKQGPLWDLKIALKRFFKSIKKRGRHV